MPNELDFAYPFYLDVPMLASFLSAIPTGPQEGEAAAASAELSTEKVWSLISGANNSFQQKYAESTLFARLRQFWQATNAISSLATVQSLDELKHGALVEGKGRLFRNPLNTALEAFLRIMSISGLDLDAPPAPPSPSPLRRVTPQTTNPMPDANSEEGNFFRIFQNLRDELSDALVQDVIMYPDNSELSVLVALPVAAMAENSFEALLSGDFRVIGKITQVVQPGEEISLYQRTAFNYILNDLFETSFADLKEVPWINVEATNAVVRGPALQILPLAIFV